MPAAIIAVWIFLTHAELVDEVYLPRPDTMWDRVVTLRAELWEAILTSGSMILIGTLSGGLAGIFVGLLFGFSRVARDLFEFTLDVIRPVPIFALIPIFILWFGIGRTPQIALVALGVFLILSFTTIEAVRNVARIHVLAAMTCGADRLAIYRTVVVPSILPQILLGVRFGFIAAWGLDVAAEFSGSVHGLGFFMIVRGQYLDTAGVSVAVLIYCSMAIIVDRGLRFLSRRLFPWSPRGGHEDLAGEILGGRG
ncbi:ABC transporter permease [Nocardioides agariphilus]|uniref:ABC transporter permease n=1 Tax=Nocardioides agariphilus TaxID=433664 RepID=A0A930VLB9_9ACTN|nr:ABC transporter permease [Nocardioides agariphilus]